MGGVQIKDVECSEYTEGLEIDRDFVLYLDGGLRDLTDGMTMYSWIWWSMWLYSMWAQDYMKVMYDIIVCGIENNLSDSAYANEEYRDKIFLNVLGRMGEEALNEIDWSRHPALVIFLTIIPYFGLWANVAYLIANVLQMFEYQAIMLELIAELK